MSHTSPNQLKDEDSSISNVPAVDRAARIMLLLADGAREMTLAEIAAATGWHKSSLHKILATLCRHGFVDRNESKQYSLGFALVRMGQSVLNNLHINPSAKTFLKELSDFSGETANMAVLHGVSMVIAVAVESQTDLRVVSPPIGTMDPVTAKSNGKAVLAWLPDTEVHKLIETVGLPVMTRNSIVKPRAFMKELAQVREQGYATDFEEFQEGISAVSAPVFGPGRRVIATLSIVGPASRMMKEKMHLYGRKCAEACARFSKK